MAGYIDVDYLRAIGSVPGALLTELEVNEPGRLEAMIAAVSRLVDSRLFKRYATPFKEPVPEAIKFAVAQIVSHQVRVVIGFDPSSEQDAQIVKARDDAFAWLTEAANASEGLVELPLREPDPGKADEAGVSRRKARAFSYRSAIDWHRAQRERR